jgi:hypothetical protein
MTAKKQNLTAELVTAAQGGNREAARGLLLLIRDRQQSGKPLDTEIHEWLSEGVRRYLAGEAATLDAALNLIVPAHRERTQRDKQLARQVCALMLNLTTEWERRTARGTLRYLSDRQAADILSALSARKPKLRERLAAILKNCPPKRRNELLDHLLKPPAWPEWAGLRPRRYVPIAAFCDRVPRGLAADNVRRIWSTYREKYTPDA